MSPFFLTRLRHARLRARARFAFLWLRHNTRAQLINQTSLSVCCCASPFCLLGCLSRAACSRRLRVAGPARCARGVAHFNHNNMKCESARVAQHEWRGVSTSGAAFPWITATPLTFDGAGRPRDHSDRRVRRVLESGLFVVRRRGLCGVIFCGTNCDGVTPFIVIIGACMRYAMSHVYLEDFHPH